MAKRRSGTGPWARPVRRVWPFRFGPVLSLQPEPLVMPKAALLVIGILGGAVAAIGVLAGLEKLNALLLGR